jgi:hypothetical protein
MGLASLLWVVLESSSFEVFMQATKYFLSIVISFWVCDMFGLVPIMRTSHTIFLPADGDTRYVFKGDKKKKLVSALNGRCHPCKGVYSGEDMFAEQSIALRMQLKGSNRSVAFLYCSIEDMAAVAFYSGVCQGCQDAFLRDVGVKYSGVSWSE